MLTDSLQRLVIIPKSPRDQDTAPPSNLAIIATPGAAGTKRSFDDEDEGHDEQPLLREIKREMSTETQGRNSTIAREISSLRIKTEPENEPSETATPTTGQDTTQSAITSGRTEPAPVVVQDDNDEFEIIDVRPAARTHLTRQSSVPAIGVPSSTPTSCEREKALLRSRLEELKIERRLMEMGG